MAKVKMTDVVRAKYVEIVAKAMEEMGEDIQFSKSNEFAFPVVGDDGSEHWVKVVVSVPTGGRDEEGYDGYGLAEAYKMKQEEKVAKAKEKAAKAAKAKAAKA